jgi:ankyrin repeat protein
MASKHSNPRLVKFLLNKGANVLDKNKDGRSPLIEASMCIELRNFSLAFMHPDEKFIKKMNIKKNYIQIIEILLLHGANINDTDYYGNNDMTCAFNNGHTEVYEELQKWTLILENKWHLAMLMTFLQELIVCHLLDFSSFIDFNEYFE